MKTHSIHTLCVHEGTRFDKETRGVNTPVYTSTSYAYLDTGDRLYPRYFNIPNQEAVAVKLAALEGAEDGLLFSSGMSAVTTVIFAFLNPGDHILFQRGLYGGTTHFIATELERFGINWSYPETNQPEAFEKALLPTTRMVYIETPSNPLLQITDIAGVTEVCRRHGILSVIDNTFASPVNQNPLKMDIDIVLHSATKYLGGHSDICAGAVVSTKELMARVRAMALNLGGSLNAQTCYLLERSMKTLALRVEKQNHNAMAIAEFLKEQDGISRVFYPGLRDHPHHDIARKQMKGFGGMLSFELKKADAEAFQKKLRLIRPSMSLGGVDTTICSPALTSHRHLSPQERMEEGITDAVLRLSVGIEDSVDLTEDLKHAIED